MTRLPARPNLEHLKKQAKDLLRRSRAGEPPAMKLHDAQSRVARQYGFRSWAALRRHIEQFANHRFLASSDTALPLWLNFAYGHGYDLPRPQLAARLLAQVAELGGSMVLWCASGDEAAIRTAIATDPGIVNRTSAALECPGCGRTHHAMPPLAAVTHSSLLRLPEFQSQLHACARLLLAAGADPNQAMAHADGPLSALYGAAGKNHDPVLTEMLLAAGANPNDGESLYHSTEARDRRCTQLLLAAGAEVAGTNAVHHQLDKDDIDGLRSLLAHTRDINELGGTLGSPLLWAIRRRRSLAHIDALLDAGADVAVRTSNGSTAYELAMQYGLADVAERLQRAGVGAPLSVADRFVAACASADRIAAQRILAENPDVLSQLSSSQLQQLPNLMAEGHSAAVRLMVELGWPIAVRGGDWDASALNHAVMRGDAIMTRYLLERGASWTEPHAFGDNVHGTLSWASRNKPPEEGDWAGCARALIDHGLPVDDLDGDYSDDVEDIIEAARRRTV